MHTMDGIFPLRVNAIKIENKVPEVKEEVVIETDEQDFGDLIEVNHTKPPESELSDDEIELPATVTLPEPGYNVLEDGIELPATITLPEPGYNVLENEIFLEPVISDKWSLKNDVLSFEGYYPLVTTPDKYISSPSSYRENHCCLDPEQQEIEKAKVELHIQEVRRHRKLRETTKRKATRQNIILRKNNQSTYILSDLDKHKTVAEQTSISKRKCYTAVKSSAAKISRVPENTRKALHSRSKPTVTHGTEWEEWVRAERERVEKHILEVRESRKRQPEERRPLLMRTSTLNNALNLLR